MHHAQPAPAPDFPPEYLGFFECFNAGRFYEAHDVLEPLWLRQRGTPIDLFYKGLIQVAGAFVHARKHRPAPALALLHRARDHLALHRPYREGLDVEQALRVISDWQTRVQTLGATPDLLHRHPLPQLPLPKACTITTAGYGVNHVEATT